MFKAVYEAKHFYYIWLQNKHKTQGRNVGVGAGGLWTPRIFETIFSMQIVPWIGLIKRETVLVLKEQFVTVGFVGQTMSFANIS